MPWTGLVKTYNTNTQTPDSAGTATAINSGYKTKTLDVVLLAVSRARFVHDNSAIARSPP